MINLFKRKKKGEKENQDQNQVQESPTKKKAMDIDDYFKKKRVKTLKKKSKKQKKKFQGVALYLERAGMTLTKERVSLILFRIAVIINLFLSFYLIYKATMHIKGTVSFVIVIMGVIWTLVLITIVFLVWLFFFMFIDIKISQRKRQVEDVLPEYLLETATNVRAGMYLEKALWYTIKPKYGVLAKEMEMVAKQTMAGYELEESIREFTKKYNSPTLTKAFDLLLEGKDAGGEVADLLTDIGENIKEVQVLKKEMASSVLTYSTFITFSSIVAAPFLFGLSHQLISIIIKVTSGLEISGAAAAQIGFNIGGGGGVMPEDFKLFAIISLISASFFSAMISSFLQEGNASAFLKKFPIYAAIAIAVFLMSSNMLSGFLGSLI